MSIKLYLSNLLCKSSNFVFKISAPLEKRLRAKSSLATRLIFERMDMWISEIVGFGTDTNPHEIHQHQTHPEKVTVWCGFWSLRDHRFVLLPKRYYGIAITVDGERYRSMISNFLWLKLDDMDTDDMWFRQDGAACHTAHATMDILRERFEGMCIWRGGDVNWPPRSCDFTPLDFFLWG